MDFSKKIELIQKKLGFTQKDFSIKLGISQNTISQYITGKRVPDINTIQKLIEIGVSPIFLFGDSEEPFDKTYDIFLKAKKISLENSNERELQSILDKFLSEELTLKKIKVKIQRKKNIEFLEKLRELANGDSERMIILFYAILLDLEKNKLLITNDNLNIKFSEIIEKHDFSYFDTLKFGIIFTKKDLSNLKNWIEKELDSVSIIEILSSLPTLKELIKNELGPINKRAISAVEKLFL
ncbi:transcriptional regulator, XRE family (plasmid) [Malaciobacter mytili LMG 24559]|nr:helix-turn-helix transcriptional regulator [Malaciobacter mytili]AXH16470.1 transcriptional regulator, XRE family [Malaciobacter mytili LMG 24559]